MLRLKSCPRCHGDMMEEKLLGEVELACLQRGYRSFPQPAAERPTTRPAPPARERLAPAA